LGLTHGGETALCQISLLVPLGRAPRYGLTCRHLVIGVASMAWIAMSGVSAHGSKMELRQVRFRATAGYHPFSVKLLYHPVQTSRYSQRPNGLLSLRLLNRKEESTEGMVPVPRTHLWCTLRVEALRRTPRTTTFI
jgi:hypothetical protein